MKIKIKRKHAWPDVLRYTSKRWSRNKPGDIV